MLLILLAFSAQASAQEVNVKPLELLLPLTKAQPSPEAVRTRLATFNTAVLRDKSTFTGAHLSFNLFDDLKLIGIVDRIDEPVSESKSWSGPLAGEDGAFTLVYYNEQPFLDVHAGERFFEVRRCCSGDTVVVQEIDTTKLPPECEDDDSMRKVFPSEKSLHVCDTNPAGAKVTIDALVVYTAKARMAAGSTTAIEGLILLNVAETNQAFERSHINARLQLATVSPAASGKGPLRIVGKCMVEVIYPETGSVKTDLERLTNPKDGYLDEVHHARDDCKADLVVMIVENADWGGKAWVMGSLSRNFAPFAFSVVQRKSSSGNYAFAHEMGHNMGGGHDKGNGDGMCTYSSGWHFTDGGVLHKSMMAYRPGRKSLNFSDPDIRYNGTGVPTGDATANNARTIRISAETVSKFR